MLDVLSSFIIIIIIRSEQFCETACLGSGGNELSGRVVSILEKFVGGSLDDATSHRKLSADASQEGVNISCTHASLVDAPGKNQHKFKVRTPISSDLPDNERLSTAAITCSEHTGKVGVVVSRGGLDVLAAVAFDSTAQDALLGAQETH